MEFEITCDTRTKFDFNQSAVPVLNKNVSYDEFFTNYMHPNVPCVLQNVTQDWQAHSEWLTPRNTPNLPHLKSKYGSCDVTIYNCNERYFNSQKTETCKFSKFLDGWEAGASKCKYLKDWHLANTFKNDHFYKVPIYFASDWLNEFLIEQGDDDYRFVYMGQTDTWTPFHADVFNSFSWSANLCGRKKWIFLPPGQEDLLRDSLNNLPYDISDICDDKSHFTLTQNPGEAVFVPSGWYHQVWNLEDTISINHNWINGCNVMKMWLAIEDNLRSVKKEIEDCQDMEGFVQHCQVVLKASFGMDFYKFYSFLEFIARKRLAQVRDKREEVLYHGHILGHNHAVFDLKAVTQVLEKFSQHGDVAELFASRPNPLNLLDEIKQKSI